MAEQPPSIAVNGEVHRVEDDDDLPLEERSGAGPHQLRRAPFVVRD